MKIRRLDLALLSGAELKVYVDLGLDNSLISSEPLALGAFQDEKPVGLLVATGEYTPILKSIYVVKEMRHLGIGMKLMSAFEDELKKLKSIVVTTIYSNDLPEAAYFEKLLFKCDWKTPVPLIYRYYFKGADFNPSWIFKSYELPQNISIIPWKSLKSEEINELKIREDHLSFPPEVSPFLNEKNIELGNSLCLKMNEKIIGWIITHRFNETTIRYSALYIEPEYKFSGFSIILLIKSMIIQKDLIKKNHPAIWAIFDLNLVQTDLNWQHFIKRRLAPHAQKLVIMNQSWKPFNY
jgi:GNAT superfamily N-acetyltransferase